MTADPLPASLFGEEGALGYSVCQLWNGGFDSAITRVSNVVGMRAVQRYSALDLLYPSCKPVSVYVNGDYIGQYWLQEVIGPEMIARKTGQPAELFEGEAYYDTRCHRQSELDTIINELNAASTDSSENGRLAPDENIDINSFLDLYTTMVYFGNSNYYMAAYREPISGKWKFIATDYDSAFLTSNVYRQPFTHGMWNDVDTLFRKIIAVDEYRDLYLQKFGTLIQTLTPELLLEEIDRCVDEIGPEMRAHFEHYSEALNTLKKDAPELVIIPDLDTWRARIDRLRTGVIVNRPACLIRHIQEHFSLSEEELPRYFGPFADTARTE